VIAILRLTRATDLITAQVFEQLFARQLGSVFGVRTVPLQPWCDAVMGPALGAGPERDSARRFAAETAGIDFICPSYEAIALTPLLAALRNRSGARVRLLIIAHSAGIYAMEWMLLHPLLEPGDVIVAPSESAGATIDYMCPALTPLVRAIPHPMEPLPSNPRSIAPRLVSLGRLHKGKLLHRQVDAMALLRDRGNRRLRMDIGGALDEGSATGAHPYARSLREQIRRLRLDDSVRLVGPIHGRLEQARFLGQAIALVNLSVTLEESCPKAPIESLGVGVPVLGTQWNGLRDTVGQCGVLLPVDTSGPADVSAESIADGLMRLLEDPPSAEACREQAAGFRPEAALATYRQALTEALDAVAATGGRSHPWPSSSHAASDGGGLLGCTPPLAQFSWRELFDSYRETCSVLRAGWDGAHASRPLLADHVRLLLQTGTRGPLERFYAHGVAEPTTQCHAVADLRLGDIADRFARAALGPEPLERRLGCLARLAQDGPVGLARSVLRTLRSESGWTSEMEIFAAETESRAGNAALALRLAVAACEGIAPGEHAVARLQQLARLARRAGEPMTALRWLVAWLERFPDSPDAGAMWLERALTASQAGRPHLLEASEALARAQTLLGELPAVARAAHVLAHQLAAA
jgi:glycosyltransferase involved in cell wall biosynthesis